MSKPYRRYPPEPPTATLWLLAVLLAVVLLANLIHQTL